MKDHHCKKRALTLTLILSLLVSGGAGLGSFVSVRAQEPAAAATPAEATPAEATPAEAEPPEEEPPQKALYINHTALEYYFSSPQKKHKQLRVKDEANTEITDAVWRSSNASVASVDRAGRVTIKKGGKAVITASYQGRRASCYFSIHSFTVNRSSLSVKQKKTGTVTLGFRNDAYDRMRVSDGRIARVTRSGSTLRIVGKKKGQCTITVYSKYGIRHRIQVTVKKAKKSKKK